MNNQYKSLFSLPDDIHYINCAYMSPLLRSVEEAGVEAMALKRNPTQIKPHHFFEGTLSLKKKFAALIHANHKQVAIIPSASYGLMSAVQNLPVNQGTEAIIVSEEFPSGYYTLETWSKIHDKKLVTIKAPNTWETRGEQWNQRILDAITDQTSVLMMSTIHWADGTLFDLEAIGEKCVKHNAKFILDGTQSVGALPIDVSKFKIDALICAGYKWLMGPYALGLAYYAENYNQGRPVEESWMNRSNAEEFSGLTNYVEEYTQGAGRYNVGESSNFILVPMLDIAIDQLLKWEVAKIEAYCEELTKPLIEFLRSNDFWVEEGHFRAKHLFGIGLPAHINKESLMEELQKQKIFVSVRGSAIRVSFHLYNTEEDIRALIGVLEGVLKKSE